MINYPDTGRFIKRAAQLGCVVGICGSLLTACVGLPTQASEARGNDGIVQGFVKVRPVEPNSRGFVTQLRFFHVLNLGTQERIRVDIQAAEKGFSLALDPGDYEVIRVRINEGFTMMESHVSLPFQVMPNTNTFLGTWYMEVDSPRTQRMLRMEILPDPPQGEEVNDTQQSKRDKNLVAMLPKVENNEVRLYTVAPYPKVNFYYR
ncbi:MAG TPA: hypothetical protein PKK23_05305 [Nitrospirales bacterium]|nr:hypothetical protein [Nitrospirales bacterium]